MRTSSSPPASHDGLRIRFLVQMLLGGAMGAGIGAILLTVFPVDVCRERWQVGPAAVLGAAALLLIPFVRFAAMRFVLGSSVLVLAGFGAWTLFLASAVGCD